MLRRAAPVLRRHVVHVRPAVAPLAARTALPHRRFYRKTGGAVLRGPEPAAAVHSFYGEAVATKVDQLVKMAGVRSRRLQLAAGLVGFSLFALWMNKEKITSTVGTQGASVVRETISNKDLQDAAEATVRKMLEQILADESLRGVAGGWVLQLLNGMQNEIGDLMAKIIRLDAVQQAAKDLVASLCKDPYIIQQVSSLVVSTIYMPVVQDAAAKWTAELVMRPDVQEKLSQTTSDTVRSKVVLDTVEEVAIRVAQGVINDPATSEMLKERLTEVAADQELQAALSDSAWRVVSRSLNPFAKHPEITNGDNNGREESAVTVESKEEGPAPEAATEVEGGQGEEEKEPEGEPSTSQSQGVPPDTPEPHAGEAPALEAAATDVPVGTGETDEADHADLSVDASEQETGKEPSSAGGSLPSPTAEVVEVVDTISANGAAEPPMRVAEEKPIDSDVESGPELPAEAAPEASVAFRETLVATGQKVREGYRKYRERARQAKDSFMARWRLRRAAVEDDSERRLFSGALRRLSGEEGKDEPGRGDGESLGLARPADEEPDDADGRDEPTAVAGGVESPALGSTSGEDTASASTDVIADELPVDHEGEEAVDGPLVLTEEDASVVVDGMEDEARQTPPKDVVEEEAANAHVDVQAPPPTPAAAAPEAQGAVGGVAEEHEEPAVPSDGVSGMSETVERKVAVPLDEGSSELDADTTATPVDVRDARATAGAATSESLSRAEDVVEQTPADEPEGSDSIEDETNAAKEGAVPEPDKISEDYASSASTVDGQVSAIEASDGGASLPETDANHNSSERVLLMQPYELVQKSLVNARRYESLTVRHLSYLSLYRSNLAVLSLIHLDFAHVSSSISPLTDPAVSAGLQGAHNYRVQSGNESLGVWLIPANNATKPAERAVMYDASSRGQGHRIELYKMLANRLSATVVAFDLRGYGDSTGTPWTSGVLEDIRTIVDWTGKMLRNNSVPGCILESTFVEFIRAAAQFPMTLPLWFLPVKTRVRLLRPVIEPAIEDPTHFNYHTGEQLLLLRREAPGVPIINFHGLSDWLVSSKNARDLQRLVEGVNYRTVLIKGGGHNNLRTGPRQDQMVAALRGWFPETERFFALN
ncbi:Monoacylglycerol lipase abhd12 [Perkinsus olseni]|uniref:Monoacylglycerol lipase abhd12 n=1 Tax=Perkinsus olseni TaxID=32597 RepID=A0A7J6MGD4_PEROL|nr:Monoacylglycerol lipase abhd12 [Perkinsus olseni]